MLVMLAFATVQCSKAEIEETTVPPSSGKTVTLTVRSAVPSSKTSIDGTTGQVFWSEGDIILVNGSDYTVTPDENDPTVATVENVTESDSYLAAYTFSYFQDDGNGNMLIYFPEIQYYKEGTFGEYANPMVAYSEDENIEFRNVGGVVKFGVTGTDSLKTLTFSSRDNGYLAGGLQIPLEDIISGNLPEQSEFNPDIAMCSRIITLDLGTGLKMNDGEPIDIYIAVPAKEYSSGFYITMEDNWGNVAIQSTSGGKTVNRSELLELPDFRFSPLQEISVSVGESSATSLTYTISGAPDAPVRAVLVYKSMWDYFLEAGYEGDTGRLAKDILDVFGTTEYLDASGTCTATATAAINSNQEPASLAADTEYMLVVSYSDGYSSKGTPMTAALQTSAPEGDAPELTISQNAVEYPYRQASHMIKTGNAVSVKYALYLKSGYDSRISAGQSDRDLLLESGQDLPEEEVAEANSTGFQLLYNNLDENTEYMFLVMATGAGGMETIKTQAFATEYYLDPSAEWDVISTEAVLECNMFYNVGSFVTNSLTVEKMAGADIFRIWSPFTWETSPYLFESGFYMPADDQESACITIDARDASAVILERTANRIGVYETGYGIENEYYLCSARIYSDPQAPLGTYDAEAGIIELSNLNLIVGNAGYYPNVSATLYLNPDTPVSGNGVTTEAFIKTPEVSW